MVLRNKLSIICIVIVLFAASFANVQAMPLLSNHSQTNILVINVLSPEVSLHTQTIQGSFARLFSQMKRTTLYTPLDDGKPKRSLTDRFGKGSISNVFDIATGNGAWMRMVPEQDWAADNVSVIGLELEEPDVYQKQQASIVDKQKDWEGLDIIHEYDQFEIVNPGTTLINETLIDKKAADDLNERLDQYDQLLRPGDWLTLANIQHEAYIRDQEFTAWLDIKKYKYEVLFPLRDYIPEDYPKSYWWNYFANGFLSAKHFAAPYLIVAQKIALSPKKSRNDFMDFFEQAI